MEKIEAGNVAGDVIVADISGKNEGMIAVGKYILQVMVKEGGYANIQAPQQAPEVRPRPGPLRALVRPFDGLLDRSDELARAVEDLLARQPVEMYGPEGMGKTALMQVIAHHSVTGAFPDGVIYLEMRGRPVEELLKDVYDAFFETSIPYYPGEMGIRQAIGEKKALVLVDEVCAERLESDLRSLANAAPGCTFVFASQEQRLLGSGHAYALPGLPDDAALDLFKRGFGREPEAGERATIQAICSALKGSPLSILQAAGLAKDNPAALAAVAAQLKEPGHARRLAAALFGRLTPPEERVLAALAALRGAPVRAHHLPKITRNAGALATLAALLLRGMVQAHGGADALPGPNSLPGAVNLPGAYSLPEAVLEQAAQQGGASFNLEAEREALLRYFTRLARQQVGNPRAILENAAPVQELLRWAAETARWKEVLHLAYLYEKALALAGHWTTWAEVLQLASTAALQLGDLAGQAWALHQMGTRAMCLGEDAAARDALVRALRIRQQIRDRAGAAVTRHNLRLILPPPQTPQDRQVEQMRALASKSTLARVLSNKWMLSALVALWLMGAATLGATVLIAPEAVPWPPGLFPTAVLSTEISQAGGTPTAGIPSTGNQTQGAGSPQPGDPATASPQPQDAPPGGNAGAVTPANSGAATAGAEAPNGDAAPANGDAAPLAPACTPAMGWPVYTVRPGDTLSALARTTGSSVAELENANCLPGPGIQAGQSLRVPELPPTPTPASTPTTGVGGAVVTVKDPAAVTLTNLVPSPSFEPTPTLTLEPPTLTPTLTEAPPTPTTPAPQPLPDLLVSYVVFSGRPDPVNQDVMTLVLTTVIENIADGTETDGPFNILIRYRFDQQKFPEEVVVPRSGEGFGVVVERVPGVSEYKLDIVLRDVDRAWLGKEMYIEAVVNRCTIQGAEPCPIPEADMKNNLGIYNLMVPTLP